MTQIKNQGTEEQIKDVEKNKLDYYLELMSGWRSRMINWLDKEEPKLMEEVRNGNYDNLTISPYYGDLSLDRLEGDGHCNPNPGGVKSTLRGKVGGHYIDITVKTGSYPFDGSVTGSVDYREVSTETAKKLFEKYQEIIPLVDNSIFDDDIWKIKKEEYEERRKETKEYKLEQERIKKENEAREKRDKEQAKRKIKEEKEKITSEKEKYANIL